MAIPKKNKAEEEPSPGLHLGRVDGFSPSIG
jgi:hypothetical protein